MMRKNNRYRQWRMKCILIMPFCSHLMTCLRQLIRTQLLLIMVQRIMRILSRINKVTIMWMFLTVSSILKVKLAKTSGWTLFKRKIESPLRRVRAILPYPGHLILWKIKEFSLTLGVCWTYQMKSIILSLILILTTGLLWTYLF